MFAELSAMVMLTALTIQILHLAYTQRTSGLNLIFVSGITCACVVNIVNNIWIGNASMVLVGSLQFILGAAICIMRCVWID